MWLRCGRTSPHVRGSPTANRGRHSPMLWRRKVARASACTAACRSWTAEMPARSRRASSRSRARAERRGMTCGGDRGKMQQTAWRAAMKRLLAIGLLLVCAGCGEMSTHSKSDVLTTTLLAYANALRWGDFEQAQSFVDPETLKTHPLSEIDRERYKQVRVASYNERPVVPVGHDEVQQIVEIGILNVNTQTE